MNLAGLWGEPVRDGKIWQLAVPSSKEGLAKKATVHFIHGMDVTRGIVAVSEKFRSERWRVSDGRVYDWWDMVWGEACLERLNKGPLRRWLVELMEEQGVKALPREGLKARKLDSRAFWKYTGTEPEQGRFKMPSMENKASQTNL